MSYTVTIEMNHSLQPFNPDSSPAVWLWRTGVSLTPCFSGMMGDQVGGGNRFNGFATVRETVETVNPEATTLCTPLKQGVTKETVGWTTDARNGFPLPFGRGEGQGEGTNENTPTGSTFPLTPALSPSAGRGRIARPPLFSVVHPAVSSVMRDASNQLVGVCKKRVTLVTF